MTPDLRRSVRLLVPLPRGRTEHPTTDEGRTDRPRTHRLADDTDLPGTAGPANDHTTPTEDQ